MKYKALVDLMRRILHRCKTNSDTKETEIMGSIITVRKCRICGKSDIVSRYGFV